MCNLCPSNDDSLHMNNEHQSSRRSLLKLMGSSPLWLGGMAASAGMVSSAMAQKPENAITPVSALKRLMDGNDRYVNNKPRNIDFSVTRKALTTGQNPYACILSCADSRVSPEFCFDEERGDLFVNRLAGNYVNADMIANIEYGVAVLNARIVMVLGHTDCGAIKASISAATKGTQYPGHIQSITTALSPAVQEGQKQKGDLLDAVTRANIKNGVASLRTTTPLIKKLYDDQKIMIVGGLYNLDTGRVEILT
ncbi:MAG: carbonic anhydrase [Polynucleobacter sp.]